MAIAIGTRVGSYEVLTLLGAGGMGEVYRARDTKLNRDVALKILPDEFTLDSDRIARFRREAQMLASLNHPNIAAIHGVEDSGSTHALVLELVEGPTLADRIAKGPIPLDEALPIAKQIAEALEAAHEQGIIHRDLKPANIKVRDDGAVKVLDFGLAKLADPVGSSVAALSQSPTITTPAQMTGVGTLLGTAAYMSPEQAKGRPADKRSDVWAFGCVVYEMLTGRRAFEGEDVSDTLAAVLRGEPDWTALPSETPAAVRTLVRRCLEKDRRRRIADISTARFVVDDLSTVGLSTQALPTATPTPPGRRVAFALVLMVAAGAALATGAFWIGRRTSPAPVVARFSIAVDGRIPPASRFASISPDGMKIVYATDRLYLRPLADATARPITGTEFADGLISYPTFSPDGSSIAFWSGRDATNGELKQVAVDGGPVATLARASVPFGMSWGADGLVYAQLIPTTISHLPAGILRVSPTGGQPQQLVALKDGEAAIDPQMLPGQNVLLFTNASGISGIGPDRATWEKARIVVQSLSTGRRIVVVDGGSAGHYVSTGHLLYTVGGTLRAMPFDAKAQRATGPSVPMLERVRRPTLGFITLGTALFSVSDTGTLLYLADESIAPSLMTVLALGNRKGDLQPVNLPPASYDSPRVSPDGKRIAYSTDDGTEAIIWTYDLSGTTEPHRLTFAGRNRYPVWTHDGQWIAFQSNRGGDNAIWWQRADGKGVAERLTTVIAKGSLEAHVPQAWSRNDNVLLFTDSGPAADGARVTLRMLTMADKKTTQWGGVDAPAGTPITASFSPDGRWVAYWTVVETQNGTRLYVQPFPATGEIQQIAVNGANPVWSRDGRELFYTSNSLQGYRLSSVAITTTSAFGFTKPATFELKHLPNDYLGYDVLPDGRFIYRASVSDAPQTETNPPIQIVLNWFEELKRRVPVK